MEINKSAVIFKFFSSIIENYIRFTREHGNWRCKLVGCGAGPANETTKLHVLIKGIKNQIIEFSPEELINNDSLIMEFSQHDVRAISFYAFHKNNNTQPVCNPDFKIYGQEFRKNETIFIIRENNSRYEYRKSSHELYSDNLLLKKFNFEDIVLILTTAIQEQTIDDLEED